ncbi:MAG: tryptophan-rich sensory protein [Cyanobacteria bacterium CRU_2_1]|nr:tryptophan-rich sensory protein [Cyanobacteria bacterium RU_5_0]NJR58724.1 tryptophan-rich sensory protein [Cyanobacteria bacterium CRU_2_1]
MTLRPLDSDLFRQWLTIVAIFGAFLVNVLSNIFPLNGLNIGEISNTLFADVKIIPANYAFVIWGLIYLGLFAFSIYQLLPAQRHDPKLRRIGDFLVIACGFQALWVFLFLSRMFIFSAIVMVGILLPLMAIYSQLEIGRHRSRQEKWFVHVPLSIYMGWITVATVVNVALALGSLRWNGLGIVPEIWTVVMVIVSSAIGALATIQRRDPAFTLVIVWALVAIAVRQLAVPMIALTAIGAAIGLGVLMLLIWKRSSNAATLI